MLFDCIISQLIVKGISKTHQDFLNINEGFFLKSPRPSFIDKAGCTRQFESELSLRSFAQLFPIKEGSTSFPKPLSPQGTGDVPTALLGAQTASL